MKKHLFISLMIIAVLLLSACSLGKSKTYTCVMNTEADYLGGKGTLHYEIIATLDSEDKISEIEVHTVYSKEETAKSDFASFQAIHGDNASIDKNVIIVKNAHDPKTLFGSAYSKTVGYTKEEFQNYIGDYTCK